MYSPAPTIASVSSAATAPSRDEHERAGCCPTRGPFVQNGQAASSGPGPANGPRLEVVKSRWESIPNVSLCARDPDTYEPEIGLEHHAAAAAVAAARAERRDPWWKNVAITEHDEEEYHAFKERMRTGALGEHRYQPSPYGPSWFAFPGGQSAYPPGQGPHRGM